MLSVDNGRGARMRASSLVSVLLYVLVFLVFGVNTTCHGQSSLDITYDPLTGAISLANEKAAYFNFFISSQSGIFTPMPSKNFFQAYSRGIEGFGYQHLDLGPIAKTGLSREFLGQDLCIRTSGFVARNGHHDVLPNEPIFLNGVVFAESSQSCTYLPDPDAFVPDPNTPLSASGESRAIIAYDATTGGLRVDVSDPNLAQITSMTTLLIDSASRIFTGRPASGLGNMFDVDRDERIFKLQPRGFRGIDFGPVAQTGLSNSFVASDLCVTATKLPNGVLPAEYLYPDAGLVPMSCGNAGEAINMNVNYVAATGDLLIDWADVETGVENGGALAAEKANLFTTVEVRSASGVFTGERPISLRGPYDRFERHRILKQDPAGFDRIYLPQAIQPGLTEEFLKGDLTIDITTLGANRLGEVSLSVATVPEPNCVSCVVIGLVAFGLHGRPHRHV